MSMKMLLRLLPPLGLSLLIISCAGIQPGWPTSVIYKDGRVEPCEEIQFDSVGVYCRTKFSKSGWVYIPWEKVQTIYK